jgi:hypothetical protein
MTEVEARMNFAAEAEAHRTPRKYKFSAPGFTKLTYNRQLKKRDPDEESPFVLGSEEALEFLKNIDVGLESMS